MELEKIRNEVLRKIGRNMVLFQQIERMLKYLVVITKYSGYASELNEIIKENIANINKQTMGQVVKRYLENIYSVSEEVIDESKELKEVWFSFSYKFEHDSFYEERKKTLALIVNERNDLAHHLLPKLDLNSFESCKATEQYLDQQREKALPEIELLISQIKAIQEGIKEYYDFFSSDEAIKYFELLPLWQSQLVEFLIGIARQKARSDGWVVLSRAACLIHQHIPQEINDIKKYGYKNMKEFLLATELFDINEELTDKGGIRVLYRIKPNLNFTE